MAIDELAQMFYNQFWEISGFSLAISYRTIPGLTQVKLSFQTLFLGLCLVLQKLFQILSFSLIKKLLYLVVLLTCIVWANYIVIFAKIWSKIGYNFTQIFYLFFLRKGGANGNEILW